MAISWKTNWIFFPKSDAPPPLILEVVNVFKNVEEEIEERFDETVSDTVLSILRPGLEKIGFLVESGKKADCKIQVPVLYGMNGKVEKAFDADAWHTEGKIVLEVEAGRGYLNNQFLKDLFEACMMHDIEYCAIAVRNLYIKNRDFEKVVSFFDTLYASARLKLPLKGVLIIGYSRDSY
ncbi:hypothetical protein JXB12_13005 [candidate division KSB1 bacterium]|nr:hypothetical protein [candidate division KSB1 bacterium]